MKKIMLSFIGAAILCFSSFAGNETVELSLQGITCGGCANKAHTAITGVEGVISSEVKYPGSVAVVEFDNEVASVDDIVAALEAIGYKATIVTDDTSAVEGESHCTKTCGGACCAKE